MGRPACWRSAPARCRCGSAPCLGRQCRHAARDPAGGGRAAPAAGGGGVPGGVRLFHRRRHRPRHRALRPGRLALFVCALGVLAWVVVACMSYIDVISRIGRVSHTIQTAEDAAGRALQRYRRCPRSAPRRVRSRSGCWHAPPAPTPTRPTWRAGRPTPKRSGWRSRTRPPARRLRAPEPAGCGRLHGRPCPGQGGIGDHCPTSRAPRAARHAHRWPPTPGLPGPTSGSPRTPARARPARRRSTGARPTPLARGPVVGTHRQPQPAQRHRHPQRQLRRLPRAGGGRRQPAARPPRRPHRHRADRPDRPVPGLGRRRPDRLDRPLGRHRAERVRRPPGAGLRHPADDRGHQGAHLHLPEIRRRSPSSACSADGRILLDDGSAAVTKVGDRAGLVAARRRAALRRAPRPTCAARCSRRPAACTPSSSRAATSRSSCRRSAARRSTSSAASADLADPSVTLTARVHDECNGSDVFGSDICTCRPYLTHAIEECIQRRAERRRRPHRLQPQGRPRARRGDQVPGLQRAQAPGRRRPRRPATSCAPNASPACRTCASRS